MSTNVPQDGRSTLIGRAFAAPSAEQTPAAVGLCSARGLGCCEPMSSRATAEGSRGNIGGGGDRVTLDMSAGTDTNPRLACEISSALLPPRAYTSNEVVFHFFCLF